MQINDCKKDKGEKNSEPPCRQPFLQSDFVVAAGERENKNQGEYVAYCKKADSKYIFWQYDLRFCNGERKLDFVKIHFFILLKRGFNRGAA